MNSDQAEKVHSETEALPGRRPEPLLPAVREALLAKIRALAYDRVDGEVFNILRSVGGPVALRRDDLLVLAALLREARRQLIHFNDVGKPNRDIENLIGFVANVVASAVQPTKATPDRTFREFFSASVDWYAALRGTPHVEAFWSAIERMTRIATLPDMRERLAAEIADIGCGMPLPQSLREYVLQFTSRPYYFSDPAQFIKVLAFAFNEQVAAGDIGNILRTWLHNWQSAFLHVTAHRDEKERRALIATKDELHTRISLVARLLPILSGRFGGLRTSLLLLVIKVDHLLFVRTGISAAYAARPWFWFMQRAFRLLGQRRRRSWPLAPRLFTAGRSTPLGLRILDTNRLIGGDDDVLVTRAQGGLGDVISMRPGLLVLARRRRTGRVVFATAKAFFPAFSVDDDIDLVDIENCELLPETFAKWVNMTDCPAVRAEAKEMPRIRTGRVDLFARPLGVHFLPFSRRRVVPIRFAPEIDTAATEIVQRRSRPGVARIGVQLRSAENYKDVPVMLEVCRELAKRYNVFVFDSRKIPVVRNDSFIAVDDQPLPRAMAMVSKMDAVIAPDSSFIHIAGCNGIPCLGIFGASDGKVRRKPYPSVQFIDLRAKLACIPCWRNEGSKCAFGDGFESICLKILDTESIVAAAEKMIQRAAAKQMSGAASPR